MTTRSSSLTVHAGWAAWTLGVKSRVPGGGQPGVDRVVDRPPAQFQCNQRFRRSRSWCLCR
jgi:hypothetical protein